MEDEHDDISNWAQGLVPEGSPGTMAQHMRMVLGDTGYEKAMEQRDTYVALSLERAEVVNRAIAVVTGFVVLYGLLGLAALSALLLVIIF